MQISNFNYAKINKINNLLFKNKKMQNIFTQATKKGICAKHFMVIKSS
jgi:hypothetical protein